LRWAILLAASLVWPAPTGAQTASPPLILDGTIPLGQVSGRIDHLGIDLKRQRLLVAELGNNSVGVVDLPAGKVLRRIAGLSEPQGVAYLSATCIRHCAPLRAPVADWTAPGSDSRRGRA
jgi:hypothetical protein